jgi:hypothetical protein
MYKFSVSYFITGDVPTVRWTTVRGSDPDHNPLQNR